MGGGSCAIGGGGFVGENYCSPSDRGLREAGALIFVHFQHRCALRLFAGRQAQPVARLACAWHRPAFCLALLPFALLSFAH